MALINVIQVIHISDKWIKVSVNVGICLGNNQDNFQLHRFTTSENIAKSFRGHVFYTHCTLREML